MELLLVADLAIGAASGLYVGIASFQESKRTWGAALRSVTAAVGIAAAWPVALFALLFLVTEDEPFDPDEPETW